MSEENDTNVDPAPEGAETLEKLQQELGEARDKYIRLFAEFDNMRKRNERERQELIKYAHEEVIIEFLGFFEDIERSVEAAKASPKDAGSIVKGLEMVLAKMRQLLKDYDVREVEALGKAFDHNCHEALMVSDADDEEDNMVVEVFQKGYTLGDRVVRTAKVRVARKQEVKEEKSEN